MACSAKCIWRDPWRGVRITGKKTRPLLLGVESIRWCRHRFIQVDLRNISVMLAGCWRCDGKWKQQGPIPIEKALPAGWVWNHQNLPSRIRLTIQHVCRCWTGWDFNSLISYFPLPTLLLTTHNDRDLKWDLYQVREDQSLVSITSLLRTLIRPCCQYSV